MLVVEGSTLCQFLLFVRSAGRTEQLFNEEQLHLRLICRQEVVRTQQRQV